jgi:hypothetical protein
VRSIELNPTKERWFNRVAAAFVVLGTVLGAIVAIALSAGGRIQGGGAGLMVVAVGGAAGFLMGATVAGLLAFFREIIRSIRNPFPGATSCPSCDKRVLVPQEMRERGIRCPHCLASFVAPSSPRGGLPDDDDGHEVHHRSQ